MDSRWGISSTLTPRYAKMLCLERHMAICNILEYRQGGMTGMVPEVQIRTVMVLQPLLL
jgi:hypothetical protein